MPWRLRKAPKNKWGDNAYWVIDDTGKHYSKDPMPKDKARQQQKALYASEQAPKKGGAEPAPAQIPTFKEYLASKGIPVGSFATEQTGENSFRAITKATDSVEFDEARFKELMKSIVPRARFESKPRAQKYEDYARDFERVQRDRATRNVTAGRRQELDKKLTDLTNKAYKDYIAEYPQAEEVSCNIGADGERLTKPERFVPAGECKRRHVVHDKKKSREGVAGAIVGALTDIADVAVDLLPGVGKVVGEVYKATAPPTSKYYGQGKGKPRGKITMSRADFKREHDKLIKLLRTSSDPAILAEADAQEKEMNMMLGGYIPPREVKTANAGFARDRAMKGAGLFSSIANVFKKTVNRVADVFKGVRRDYPPDVRQTLAVIGGLPIVEMNIRRDPIRDVLNTAFNLVTRGKWNEIRKKYAYDKLFHLGVEITLADGRKYVAEKNQTLNIAPAKPSDSQTERMPVNLPAGNMTVNEMLFKTQERQGDKFFLYDAFSNNCQDWISDLLVANGLATPQNLAFVKQPLENVLAELPSYTQGFARVATDIGALADVALKGRGRARPHPAFAKQLREVGIKPMEYIGAVRSLAKKNGYDPADVSFADTPEHKIAIKRPDGGITRAGRVGYGDFIIWSYMESHKMTPAGMADKKRDTFRKSHSKIKGDWKADKFSPNNIALNLLW